MSNLPSNHLYDLPPSLHPSKIAKSDLPSNRLYDLPPHQNCQVQFTLKSPSPIYPQIVCTIYPPKNRQVRFTLKLSVRFTPPPPEITKSDLPSNRQVRFTPSNRLYDLPPPPEIAKSDLPSNRQVQFTPQIVCTIYPPSPLKLTSPFYNHLYDLPSNCLYGHQFHKFGNK